MVLVREWELYRPIREHFKSRGFHVASSVTDPAGSRFELDVVAFTADLQDVRVIEAKREATDALLAQCLDRLRYAPRVYAAVPDKEGDRLLERESQASRDALGIIEVVGPGVRFLREASALEARLEAARQHELHRALLTELAEGRA